MNPSLAMSIGNEVGERVETVATATATKTRRKVSAYNRKYKAAFKKVAPRYKLKNGKWSAGGFKRAVKEAHRIAGGKKR
jgi:ribosomal protein L17